LFSSHFYRGYLLSFILLIFHIQVIAQKSEQRQSDSANDKPNSPKVQCRTTRNTRVHCRTTCNIFNGKIIYDAFTGEFQNPIPKYVKEGTLINIQIKNVNLELINTPEITQTQLINPFLDVPVFFSSSISAAAPLKKDTSKKNSGNSSLLPPVLRTARDTFLCNYKIFILNYNTLKRMLRIKDDCFQDFNFPIFDEKKAKINLINQLQIVLNNNNNNLIEFPRLISETFSKAIINMDSTYLNMLTIYDRINANQKKDTNILRRELTVNKKEKVPAENAVLPKNPEPQLVNEMNDVKKKYKILSTDSARNMIYGQLQDIINKILFINKSDFTFKSDPIIIDEDGKTFSFSVKDKQGKVLRQSPVLTIKTKDKFKLDFSAGFFFGSQQNDKYYSTPGKIQFLKPTTSDSLIKVDSIVSLVKKGSNQPINFSVGALLNAYYDFGSPIAFGLSFGISYPVASMPAFTGGVSMLLTAKHRLVVTFGGSYANVKKLSGENIAYSSNGQMYIVDPTVQLKYDDVYKFGWFLGITFNFAKLVK